MTDSVWLIDYRKLIGDGVVVDPNYVVDEAGKLTFRKGVKRLRPGAVVEGDDGTIQPVITDAKPKNRPTAAGSHSQSASGGKKSSKKRRKSSADSDSDSKKGGFDESEEEDDGQPFDYVLDDMVDAMTMKRMKVPAISPYGHVLNYTTWLRLLKEIPVNTCPFTKQKVSRRDLVKLTRENVEQYRDKIVPVAYTVGQAGATSSSSAGGAVEEHSDEPEQEESEKMEIEDQE